MVELHHSRHSNSVLAAMDPAMNIPKESRILSSNDSVANDSNGHSHIFYPEPTTDGHIVVESEEPIIKVKTENMSPYASVKDANHQGIQSSFSCLDTAQSYAALAHSAALDVLSSVSASKSLPSSDSSSGSSYAFLGASTSDFIEQDQALISLNVFTCNICNLSFKNETELKTHVSSRHAVVNRSKSHYSRRHAEVNKPFKCDICSATFTQMANMKTHQRIHTGERPFNCTECGATFTQISNLKTHKKLHSGEKPFICDVCHARFTQLSNLKSHRLIHTGERPYKCDFCDSSFVQSTHLRNHRRIHTNERPYSCEHCGASFRQLSNLKTHEKTHTGEKPHICSECGSAFAQKSNLKSHMLKQHRIEDSGAILKRGKKIFHGESSAADSFVCDVCGSSFVSGSNLKVHLRLHTGEKPFTCSICFMSFSQKSNLKSHELTHSDVKPYACPDCPSAFKQKANLRTHINKKHDGFTMNFSPFLPNMTGSSRNIHSNMQFSHSEPSTSNNSLRSPSEKYFIIENGKSMTESIIPLIQIRESKMIVKSTDI